MSWSRDDSSPPDSGLSMAEVGTRARDSCGVEYIGLHTGGSRSTSMPGRVVVFFATGVL